MNAVKPRALVHRGVHEAAGVLIDPSVTGLRAARARVISSWRSGDVVYELDGALLHRFASPHPMDARRAPGTMLIARGSLLLTAPLGPKDLEALGGPSNGLVVVRDGVAVHRPLPSAPVDMSAWLDVSAFEAVTVTTLGAPPAPVKDAVEPVPFDARQKLVPGLGPPSKERAEFLAALEGKQAGLGRSQGGIVEKLVTMLAIGVAGVGFGTYRGVQSVPFLRNLSDWFDRFFGVSGSGAPGNGGAGGGRAGGGESNALARPSKPSPIAEWLQKLNAWAARQVAKSKLGRLFAQRHAEYLAKLFEMFENNDLDEALRHAIPLTEGGKLFDQPALGAFGPRGSLEISLRGATRSSGVSLSTELYDQLRRKYRLAFERLILAGRIRDAAFILLELLGQVNEAISFLESYGELKLAAEIAEARELSPGLVVRLWFLAGDVQRAVLIARRTGAFNEAITQLEKSNPEQAKALRMLWADQLATAGHFAAAVDVIWSVPEARHLAGPWLEAGFRQSDAGAMRLAVRRIAHDPTSFPEVRDRVLPLLASTDPATMPLREGLAQSILGWHRTTNGGAANEAVVALVNPVVRSLLRNWREHRGSAEPIKQVAAYAPVQTLSEDLPPLGQARPPTQVQHDRFFGADDVGHTPISDAALLPDGRMLVALGEAGAQLISRDGRVVASFDRPAVRLVVSDQGDRALALMPRDKVISISRLDLNQRTAQFWCDADLITWADSYDGDHWFAADHSRILAIDTTSRDFRSIWSVKDMGAIKAIARASDAISILQKTRDDQLEFELWRYSLPNPTLRSRQTVATEWKPMPDVDPNYDGGYGFSKWSITAAGAAAAVMTVNRPSRHLFLRSSGPGTNAYIPLEAHETEERAEGPVIIRMSLSDTWLVTYDSHFLTLRRASTQQTLCTWRFAQSRYIRVRLTETHLTCCDDRGRVMVLDLSSGNLVRNFRL